MVKKKPKMIPENRKTFLQKGMNGKDEMSIRIMEVPLGDEEETMTNLALTRLITVEKSDDDAILYQHVPLKRCRKSSNCEKSPNRQKTPNRKNKNNRKNSFFDAPRDQWQTLEPSEHAERTVNNIRRIVDVLEVKPNPDKPLISVNIGDPTKTGALPTHPKVIEAVTESLMSGKYNGYGPATGYPEVREALAEFVTCPEAPVTADDLILTSGCSHGIQMAIEVLTEPGTNILVPSPGFPLYGTLCEPLGVEQRHYNLLVELNWEVDLDHMESLIDENTRAIVVNNPSNPCGAVYSKEHLEAILKMAEKHKIPVIADEIYNGMVYGGAKFHPLATLEPKVPMIVCDGLSKRWLVPGWRLGWLIIHDRHEVFSKIRIGLRQLAQKIVGPCAVIQGALPAILKNTPPEFFERTNSIMEKNAAAVEEELEGTPGLRPVSSKGAMYMMLSVKMDEFPVFKTESELVEALIAEESVFCLPGTAFFYPNALRMVLTWPEEKIREACQRIKSFCERHHQKASDPVPNGFYS